MNTLFSFTPYQSEAMVICLAVSIVWAGALFMAARANERKAPTKDGRIWIGALFLGVAPSLLAPMLAAFGLSLRAPEPETANLAPAILEATTGSLAPRIAIAAEPVFALTADQAIAAAAIIYAYGAALALFIFFGRAACFALAAARARPLDDPALADRVAVWARQIGVDAPRIRRSGAVSSVCIFGAVRPIILIPDDIDAAVTTDDLALMVAHELAHLRRGDTRLFTATALTRVLFWFNPLMKKIAAHVELAAEEGADAMVLSAGVDRRAYAACFVEGLKFAARRTGAQIALAPSFTPADRRGRRRRLDNILHGQSSRRAPLARRVLLGVAAAGGVLIAVVQAALAVDPDSGADRRRAQVRPDGANLTRMPVKGDVTLGFEQVYQDAEGGGERAHHGVDIKAPKGTPVEAAGAGVVVEATDYYKEEPSFGKVVILDHGHGLLTRYAHLDSYSVRQGDRVKAGDIIAKVGATGKVTGPHLHFETLQNGARIDPVAAIAPPAPIAPVSPVSPSPSPNPLPAPSPAPIEAAEPTDDFGALDFHFTEPEGFVDALGEDWDYDLVKEIDGRLLGPNDADIAFKLSFTDKEGKTHRFTNNELLTPEGRAAFDALRRDALEASRRVQEANRNWRRDWRREAQRLRETAMRQAREAVEFSEDARREAHRAQAEARREALEAERQALEDAKRDLEESAQEDFEAALEDLSDAEADIESEELSKLEREAALAAIEEARSNLENQTLDHKRAIENAQRQIDERCDAIEREIATLVTTDDENN